MDRKFSFSVGGFFCYFPIFNPRKQMGFGGNGKIVFGR